MLRVLTTKLYNGEYAPSFASIFSEARLSQADEAWDHSSGGTQTTEGDTLPNAIGWFPTPNHEYATTMAKTHGVSPSVRCLLGMGYYTPMLHATTLPVHTQPPDETHHKTLWVPHLLVPHPLVPHWYLTPRPRVPPAPLPSISQISPPSSNTGR